MKSQPKSVFVGMSGGVDSSVAALLLSRRGYDVTGVFMRCYNVDGCAERDAEDARRVAAHLKIPFYVWDFEEEYKKRVVEYMIGGYRRGETPNPDVECNREIKFGLFFDRARELGADLIATGHYVLRRFSSARSMARSSQDRWFCDDPNITTPAPYRLFAAKDANKDQSYFLWTLTQKQLAHCLFPIGDYLKSEVRAIARKAGLPTAEKKDSQGICFLGQVNIRDFLREYIPERQGIMVTPDGMPVGEHRGAQFYTIGQRHIGAMVRSSQDRRSCDDQRIGTVRDTKPHYVAAKDVKSNILVVAEGDDHPALYRKEIVLRDVNLIVPLSDSLIRANRKIRVMTRVRYRQPLAPATLLFSDSRRRPNFAKAMSGKQCFGGQARESENKKKRNGYRVKLVFEKPQKFIAAGQSAVFYGKNGELLGGGVIASSV